MFAKKSSIEQKFGTIVFGKSRKGGVSGEREYFWFSRESNRVLRVQWKRLQLPAQPPLPPCSNRTKWTHLWMEKPATTPSSNIETCVGVRVPLIHPEQLKVSSSPNHHHHPTASYSSSSNYRKKTGGEFISMFNSGGCRVMAERLFHIWEPSFDFETQSGNRKTQSPTL